MTAGQNQQNDLCSQWRQHLPSLCCPPEVDPQLPISAQWRLISLTLGGCPSWTASLLGTHHFVGSVMVRVPISEGPNNSVACCYHKLRVCHQVWIAQLVIPQKMLERKNQRVLWPVTWQNQQNECVPSEDSDQPGHLPSLIDAQADQSSLCTQWVTKDPRFLHADSEDWSDWADAQADLSLCWEHTHFVGFVMSQLLYSR